MNLILVSIIALAQLGLAFGVRKQLLKPTTVVSMGDAAGGAGGAGGDGGIGGEGGAGGPGGSVQISSSTVPPESRSAKLASLGIILGIVDSLLAIFLSARNYLEN